MQNQPMQIRIVRHANQDHRASRVRPESRAAGSYKTHKTHKTHKTSNHNLASHKRRSPRWNQNRQSSLRKAKAVVVVVVGAADAVVVTAMANVVREVNVYRVMTPPTQSTARKQLLQQQKQ